jgi:hypothetical protein
MFGRLKDWRKVATRYDRCPKVFLSADALAATVMFWLWHDNGSWPYEHSEIADRESQVRFQTWCEKRPNAGSCGPEGLLMPFLRRKAEPIIAPLRNDSGSSGQNTRRPIMLDLFYLTLGFVALACPDRVVLSQS